MSEPSSCCTPLVQATCCGPTDKETCCGESAGDGCGCGAGRQAPVPGSS